MFSEVSNLTEFSRSSAERERERAVTIWIVKKPITDTRQEPVPVLTGRTVRGNRGRHFRDRHTLSRHCHEGHSEWKEHAGERKK